MIKKSSGCREKRVGDTKERIWLGREENLPNMRFLGAVSIPVGGVIPRHIHMGDQEICIVSQGEGIYFDNGCTVRIERGDILICREGECHGISNTGECALELLRIVIGT